MDNRIYFFVSNDNIEAFESMQFIKSLLMFNNLDVHIFVKEKEVLMTKLYNVYEDAVMICVDEKSEVVSRVELDDFSKESILEKTLGVIRFYE